MNPLLLKLPLLAQVVSLAATRNSDLLKFLDEYCLKRQSHKIHPQRKID